MVGVASIQGVEPWVPMGEMTTDVLLGNLTDPLREADSGPITGHGNDVPPHRSRPAHPDESLPSIEGPTRCREHGNPNRAWERWRSSASASQSPSFLRPNRSRDRMLERANGTHRLKRKPPTRHRRTPGARERFRSCTKSTPNGPANLMREGTSTRTDAARPAFPWSTYRSRERPTSTPRQWRVSANKTASPSTA